MSTRRVGVGDHRLGATDRIGAAQRPSAAAGISHYLDRAAAVRGAVRAQLVDLSSGRTLRALVRDPAAARADVGEVIAAVLHVATLAPALDSDTIEDIVLTTGDAYHLVRPVCPGADPRVVLHLQVERPGGSLALARRHLRALSDRIG